MSARIIEGEAFTVDQIAARLGVVNATVRNRLAQVKKPYTWDALKQPSRKRNRPSPQWRTGEERLARAAYYIGGSRLAHALVPTRSIQSIVARAKDYKWPIWTRLTPGSHAAKAVEMAMQQPVVAPELAAEINRSTTHASAVLGELYRRGVLARVMERSHMPSVGDEHQTDNPRYTYSISQRYRDAYNETQVS